LNDGQQLSLLFEAVLAQLAQPQVDLAATAADQTLRETVQRLLARLPASDG
jgi:hypothetical protein